ncbi:acyltransferase [Mangrovactinospora gilvigrisea]|uniref:Acyltransferase n=1 Tax=Mangrovactinospora gilvigrisea TaxID=1428644 RepID=A0A1J7CD64_9ACTN|nr:acyltransferase [Mangrovactinospora gilvigrisea]OIV37610.1 acyltransferase [Mangrovactinospora gilvigrisea]
MGTLHPGRGPLRRTVRTALERAASSAVHRTERLVRRVGAITAERPGGHRFGRLDGGTTLAWPQGTLFGERWISIGAYCVVAEQVTLTAGLAPGDELDSEDPILEIGDGCVIGRGSHLVGRTGIALGDHVYLGPGVYITDHNHTYTDTAAPIGTQWPVFAPVRIGAGSWLGANAVVLPGTVLGRNTVVAAGCIVRGEFPDHAVLAGVPARMVRRYDPAEGWVPPLGNG